MNKTESDAMNDCVRSLIERTVSTLQAIGMKKEDALQLLAIQAIVRMHNAEEIAKLQRFIDNDHDNQCGVAGLVYQAGGAYPGKAGPLSFTGRPSPSIINA
jgi:hypothetical protein